MRQLPGQIPREPQPDSERRVGASPSERPRSDVPPLDITTDPDTLSMVFEALRLLAGGVALTYFGYTLYNLTRLEAPGVSRVMLFDQVALGVVTLVFWLAHTQRIPRTRVHIASATLAITVAGNTAISSVIYGTSSDLRYMIAVAIGGAAIVVSKRWLATLLVGTLACSLPAAIATCSHNELVDFIVVQLAASVIAVIIFTGRVRGQRQLLEYRIADADKTRELQQALQSAAHEFEEHQVTERQKLALMDQLRQAQKLEALGTLAGGVAHDINNVIGAITAIASTSVQEMPQQAQGRKELVQILVAARRGTTLTRNLVRFARQDQPQNAPFFIDDVVLEVEALLRRTLAKQIELKAQCDCQGWATIGDSGLISHALMNLCLNAADAISERGSITIETRARHLSNATAQKVGLAAGEYIELQVRDDGHGMPREVVERAFEPFFSTKDNKRRSGLGLAMVYGTIQQHHGAIWIESEVGHGSRFFVALPAFLRELTPIETKSRKPVCVESQRPIALFVDDEPLLRRAGRRMLANLGYEVLLAGNGRDALQRFEEHRARIGVVVLDVAMPVMSGAECCAELRRIDPCIPVILASGFPKGHDLHSLLAVPRTRYVRKPYELEDLASSLSELAEESERNPKRSSRISIAPVPMESANLLALQRDQENEDTAARSETEPT